MEEHPMRLMTLVAFFFALASAFLLYGINYDTRRIEALVHAKERAVERAQRDIAVLKAERALLARPERIEPLARAQGMRPMSGSEYAETRTKDQPAVEKGR
jgi:cell division protein FtsL